MEASITKNRTNCIETCHSWMHLGYQSGDKTDSSWIHSTNHENHLAANFSSTNLHPRRWSFSFFVLFPVFSLAGQSGSPFRLELSLSASRADVFQRTHEFIFLSAYFQFQCLNKNGIRVQIDAPCYFRRIPGEDKYRRFVVRYVSTCFISTFRFVRRVELIVRERDKIFVE